MPKPKPTLPPIEEMLASIEARLRAANETAYHWQAWEIGQKMRSFKRSHERGDNPRLDYFVSRALARAMAWDL